MITNYERIKNMNLEEMATEIGNIVYLVTIENKINSFNDAKQWLQSESEE